MRAIGCEECHSKEKSIFCGLENQDLASITQNKVMNQYKKGQNIFLQGNPPFGLFCINSGKIKVSKTGQDGKESIVRIAGPGDVLGHRSLFAHENYAGTATVIEDAAICFLDKKFILKTLETKPSLALGLIETLSKEMGQAEQRNMDLVQKNVRERLAGLLVTFKTLYGVKEKEGGRWRLDIKLTREELASMVGTASETIIRFISEFKDEGIIEQEGKTIFIVDGPKLIEFANLDH